MTNSFPQAYLLIGSTFPLSLIRRQVLIEPKSIKVLKKELSHRRICSFWGHDNTLATVQDILNTDLTPIMERPVLRLDEKKLPMLQNKIFNECWVVSPDYMPGFRPEKGMEVTADKISGWQVLKITWIQ